MPPVENILAPTLIRPVQGNGACTQPRSPRGQGARRPTPTPNHGPRTRWARPAVLLLGTVTTAAAAAAAAQPALLGAIFLRLTNYSAPDDGADKFLLEYRKRFGQPFALPVSRGNRASGCGDAPCWGTGKYHDCLSTTRPGGQEDGSHQLWREHRLDRRRRWREPLHEQASSEGDALPQLDQQTLAGPACETRAHYVESSPEAITQPGALAALARILPRTARFIVTLRHPPSRAWLDFLLTRAGVCSNAPSKVTVRDGLHIYGDGVVAFNCSLPAIAVPAEFSAHVRRVPKGVCSLNRHLLGLSCYYYVIKRLPVNALVLRIEDWHAGPVAFGHWLAAYMGRGSAGSAPARHSASDGVSPRGALHRAQRQARRPPRQRCVRVARGAREGGGRRLHKSWVKAKPQI
ncbi:hypothetical protein T492DRAFT_847535 [Pavlovales sp. CCMP2436]|nr:hypothetical protein T492DRAFT_847535 [Pavlovales sp. CCMP2436]